MNRIKNSATQQ